MSLGLRGHLGGKNENIVVRPIRRNRVIAQPPGHVEGSSFNQRMLAIWPTHNFWKF